jgi:hypothetical protein
MTATGLQMAVLTVACAILRRQIPVPHRGTVSTTVSVLVCTTVDPPRLIAPKSQNVEQSGRSDDPNAPRKLPPHAKIAPRRQSRLQTVAGAQWCVLERFPTIGRSLAHMVVAPAVAGDRKRQNYGPRPRDCVQKLRSRRPLRAILATRRIAFREVRSVTFRRFGQEPRACRLVTRMLTMGKGASHVELDRGCELPPGRQPSGCNAAYLSA